MARKPLRLLNFKTIIFIGGVVLATLACILWVLRPLPSPLTDGSGSCIVRGGVNMPEATAPNIEKGYARLQKQGIQTIDTLKNVCSRADYERLALQYCLRNSLPYTEEVVTYNSRGEITVTCGANGCNDHYCFSFANNGLLHDLPYLLFPPLQSFIQPTPTVVQYSPVPLPPPPHTTYTSANLGISFTYINTVAGIQIFFTKEIGDKVYLYNNLATNQSFIGTDAEFLQTIAPGAYSVEVFTKDPNLSLEDAIRQRFLTGYSEDDCFINTNYGNGFPREDKDMITAAIVPIIPNRQNLSYSQISAYIDKCPGGYTEGGRGIEYFMMDTKHPGKMLFVKVGQSNIPSGVGGLTWDRTIKVLQ